ncbi:bifunctional (p)ppGpp synthetase/guanosine-3',5'-bis(diphosphate) 3'-pyrophosphohydrolase [Lawsonia intracellularis]|uniref:RelA/SpoT family protein n=1 Tax=Lawsonia intracellularis TaxID=29546 RepID=UPI0002ADBC12|nr:bifunctional (p)ppGpp synthetase/guanosine-3',5'-bis(diphosphate) 3'-pyrophosphohydrolase [Lawsonia intracellularis]AGC49573.1 guanosine polyphosphate pyrophosphohydrolase/synthetase [Lawsonia intracellularis N343]KAA0205095.1 bifunctional (p)ppGpp synthetase/guanosine-3',5'-bis(diphosphate) 3'-pyrophosphohydrolase [Lawsonia intracellularis]MBZ3892379.1 bifunctional (p)ppGpp synthetase/guanosine-3',5'-bis(diphosphate) 3'-pyrophosphohydrolase [Lawsonia intracellularis]OMQ06234.1 GTP pyrophosp
MKVIEAPTVGLPTPMQNVLRRLEANKATATERSLVQKAYVYAAAAHEGQLRLSGEPYLSHPLAVAEMLSEMGFDAYAIMAALLHDTVEDTKCSLEDIETEFGKQVADIVNGVTKISMMSFESKEEQQAENFRKMILAMSQDIRVPIVKLADRLHNMRTLNFQKPHKRQSIAQETMDIYAPLANRLGLHRIKLELEDLSFKYLHPDIYTQISTWMHSNRVVERNLIERIISKIKAILHKNGLKGTVQGRVKHVYSIHKKMVEQHLTLDSMHDILAFRVIVDTISDCYAVLGLLHSQWKPLHGRFKDYISMPKVNGYQSLHTTVMGPEGERIEIQIRTNEMHKLAEQGVASHWLYKERNHSVNLSDVPQFEWLREVLDRQKDEKDSLEFMQSLRLELFKDEVYVFTPAGDVKELPKGATPLDFAFLIHTEIGNHCVGSRVNGKLVPLYSVLKSGDTVEIITDKNRYPSRDWLKIVKTAKARNRIQQYLRTEEKAAAISLGRELLEKEGRKLGISLTKAEKEGHLISLATHLSLGSVDELLASVGYARNTPRYTLKRLQTLMSSDETSSYSKVIAPHKKKKESSVLQNFSGVTVRGIDNMLVRFAKCCNPVPGDSIVGFISRGRGVIVHTETCPNVQALESDRLVSVQWDGHETVPFPARIYLVGINVVGLLADIALVFKAENVNVESCIVQRLIDGRSEMDATIGVRDIAHLYQVIDKLRQLPNIVEVLRKTADE